MRYFFWVGYRVPPYNNQQCSLEFLGFLAATETKLCYACFFVSAYTDNKRKKLKIKIKVKQHIGRYTQWIGRI